MRSFARGRATQMPNRISTPPSACARPSGSLSSHQPKPAAALLALAIISQVGGQGLVAVALGTLPATFSSLVIFLEAVAAAGFGWWLLNEPLGLAQAFGGVLILVGIWVARPRANDLVAGP